MATGRTVAKHTRIYAGMYGTYWTSSLCGLTRSIGPLAWTYDEIDATGMCDSIKGYLPGQASISTGPINVIMDPVASDSGGFNSFMYPPATYLVANFTIGDPMMVQIPIGIRAAPAAGDPVFAGIFPFLGMTYSDDGGLVTATFDMGSSAAAQYIPTYDKPWGQLLHAYSTESASNSSAGIDSGAASTNGGIMFLQTMGPTGSTAYTVQHADTNTDGSFANLTGASITTSSAGNFIATVAVGTAVKRYLRWQVSAGPGSGFVMSFIRG